MKIRMYIAGDTNSIVTYDTIEESTTNIVDAFREYLASSTPQLHSDEVSEEDKLDIIKMHTKMIESADHQDGCLVVTDECGVIFVTRMFNKQQMDIISDLVAEDINVLTSRSKNTNDKTVAYMREIATEVERYQQ